MFFWNFFKDEYFGSPKEILCKIRKHKFKKILNIWMKFLKISPRLASQKISIEKFVYFFRIWINKLFNPPGHTLIKAIANDLFFFLNSHELQTCDWPRNVGCPENSLPSKDIEDDDPLLERWVTYFTLMIHLQLIRLIFFLSLSKVSVDPGSRIDGSSALSFNEPYLELSL